MKTNSFVEEKFPMNQNGLTLAQWLSAAGYSNTEFNLAQFKAWRNSEDPADYRAEK
jgi:hypothetical protein